MAISDEIKQQTSKFKDMTKEEKRDYIWTYYKWWILGAIAIVYFIISIISSVIKNSRPVFVDVVFLNSDYESYATEASLEDDFAKEMNIDPEKELVSIDYTMTLSNFYGNQAAVAGQTKLISMYSAEQLDVCCGQEGVMTGSADVGGYTDFSQIFTKEELEDLENKGYEFFTYTEKIYDDSVMPDADGNRPYTEGESYIAGIYIDNCEALTGKYGVYSDTVFNQSEEGRYVITIAWNAPHVENAKEFIKFITK